MHAKAGLHAAALAAGLAVASAGVQAETAMGCGVETVSGEQAIAVALTKPDPDRSTTAAAAAQVPQGAAASPRRVLPKLLGTYR